MILTLHSDLKTLLNSTIHGVTSDTCYASYPILVAFFFILNLYIIKK